jgi:hypothetical protein
MAADWNFYGQIRFATYSIHNDTDTDAYNSSTTSTQWEQQSNTRFGAAVKFNDQIGGYFQMGLKSGNADGDGTVTERLFYGTYTFGNGAKLIIGQKYAISAWFLSNQVFGDNDLLNQGEFYEGRHPMIQLNMGNFKIALATPVDNKKVYTVNEAGAAGADNKTSAATIFDDTHTDVSDNYTIKDTIPKIEVAYDFKADTFFANAFAGYQTYDLDGTTSAIKDVTVNSYVFGVGGGVNFGALYVKAGVHYGQNLGNYGGGLNGNMVIDSTGSEKDSTGWGALGVVGFNVSDMLTIEAGYGHEYGEEDLNNTDGATVDVMYVNAPITIAPGFVITPEIGYQKSDGDTYGRNPDPNPTQTYFGAKWQINF